MLDNPESGGYVVCLLESTEHFKVELFLRYTRIEERKYSGGLIDINAVVIS